MFGCCEPDGNCKRREIRCPNVFCLNAPQTGPKWALFRVILFTQSELAPGIDATLKREMRMKQLQLVAVMDEQFILRVPPNVAERIERLLNESNPSSSEDKSLDLTFSEDGRSGTFMIGNETFPASLLDLPCVVESYKTYDDNSLIKSADIGQMIMVRESGDAAPDVIEYRHGLTPPMRDARKRRFRREPDLNPELVSRVEKDLLKIMAGGTADNLDILTSLFVSYNNLVKISILKYKSLILP
ncbi:Transcription initiation factor TFIID subunit 7, partial [Mucuna pruriens]